MEFKNFIYLTQKKNNQKGKRIKNVIYISRTKTNFSTQNDIILLLESNIS